MNQILGELGKSQKFKELLNQIENKQSPIAISGLNDVGAVQIETAINQFGKSQFVLLLITKYKLRKYMKMSNILQRMLYYFQKRNSYI